MKQEIIHSLTKNFESFAQKTDDGLEFWFARDLQKLLGYSKWVSFSNVIDKAKISCEIYGEESQYHFAHIGKMVGIGSGAQKEIDDFMPTILLKAKEFASAITVHNAKEKDMKTENQISSEHVPNNKSVRSTLISRGIVPEKILALEDVKKVERKVESEKKKEIKKITKNK